MFINDNVKYRDILIFALIGIIGYKLIDNYNYFFNIINKAISILTPFIYAFICAYILNPVVGWFTKGLKISRGVAIAITYLILIGAIFIGSVYTIPSIIDSIVNISSDIPSYVSTAQKWLDMSIKNENINELITQTGLMNNLQEITNSVGNIAMNILQNSTSYLLSFTSNLVNLIFGFIISVYVLLEKDNIISRSRTMTYMIFKRKKGELLIEFVRTYNKMIGTYVGIKALDSLIIGTIALIGFLLLKVPYAPLLAVVVAITNMIPYFGPLVGIVISSIVTIFTSIPLTIMTIIMLFAIQQFDAWYLEAKLVGKKVGVSPLAIIFGVTVGGGILGPVGMLLGSPTMATIRIYYNKLVEKYKNNNKEEKLTKEEEKINRSNINDDNNKEQ